jgi:hypothetical protein
LVNFLTSSGVKLECFGSILLLVLFLLISTAAVPRTAWDSRAICNRWLPTAVGEDLPPHLFACP